MSLFDLQLIPVTECELNQDSPFAAGLVFAFPMLYGASGKLKDASNRNHDFTRVDGVPTPREEGLYFNGSTRFTTPDHNDFLVISWSASALVKRPAAAGSGVNRLFSRQNNAGTTPYYGLVVNANNVSALSNLDSIVYPTGYGPALNDDRWHRIDVDRLAGSKFRYYVDGRLVQDTTITNTSAYGASDLVSIGAYRNSGEETFTGIVRDLRFYNRSRAPGEIAANHANWADLYLPLVRRSYFFLEPGTAVALETTIASTSTVSASLSQARPIAATIASASAVTASLSAAMPLAATVASVSAVSASLSAAMPLAATVASVSAVTADLTIAGALSATVASISTVSASLSVAMPLTCTIASASAVTASITNTVNLSTTIASASSVSAALSAAMPLAATVASVSAVTAALSAAIPLAATIASVSAVTAVISGGEVQSPLGRLAVAFGLKYSLSLSFTVAGMALSTDTDIGDVVTTTATCTNSAGTATNPTAMSFFIQEPSGVITEYVYGTDDEVDRPSTGVFTFDFPPIAAGKHVVRAVATGALIAAQRDAFTVRTQY